MFPGQLRFRTRSTSSDIMAFLNFVGIAAFNNAQRIAYTNFILALKTDGTWEKLDAIWLWRTKVSQACANTNLRQPGRFTCVPVTGVAGGLTAPVWTSNVGYATLSGDQNYVDSGYTPSTAGGKLTQNDASLLYRQSSNAQHTNNQFGWDDGSNRLRINARNGSDQCFHQVNQNASTGPFTSTDITGHWACVRTASNALTLRRSGSLVGSSTTASTGLPSGTLKLGRHSSGGYQTVTGAEYAAVGAALTAGTPSQQKTFRDAYDAYVIAMDAS